MEFVEHTGKYKGRENDMTREELVENWNYNEEVLEQWQKQNNELRKDLDNCNFKVAFCKALQDGEIQELQNLKSEIEKLYRYVESNLFTYQGAILKDPTSQFENIKRQVRYQVAYNENLKQELNRLKSRNLLQRIFNKD